MQTPPPPARHTFARAPVMGAAIGGALVLLGICANTNVLVSFFSLSALIIVIGGVIAVAFMSFEAADVHKALEAILAMLWKSEPADENLVRDIEEIMEWARLIKEGGKRKLEGSVSDSSLNDPFVTYGLNMLLGDYPAEDVRIMMQTASDAAYDRESVPIDVLHAMTSHAPAFGMVGTLVGMVAMLCNLHDNISSLGSTLAVAFLSTLYGVISARMVYMPATSRLQQQVDASYFHRHLITEGIVMLANDKPASYIKDRLNGFLRPEVHDYFDSIARPEKPGPQQQPATGLRGNASNIEYGLRSLKAITR
jgi:chemotaxis protein MotA